MQERKAETQQFPYRYSYYQEEAAQIWRDYWGRGPDLFFMTTEEMHALLSDLQALGAAQIGVKRVAQEDEEDEKPEHHVHATKQWETIITREDMLALGWPELHIRWLLSQIGVLDEQAEEGEEGDETEEGGDANGAEDEMAVVDTSPDGRVGDEFDEFVEDDAEGAAASSDMNGVASAKPRKATSGGGTTSKEIRAGIAAAVNQAKTEIMHQHQRDVNRLRKDLLAAIAQLQDPGGSALTAAAMPSEESDDGGTVLAPASAPPPSPPPAPEAAANTGRRRRRLS